MSFFARTAIGTLILRHYRHSTLTPLALKSLYSAAARPRYGSCLSPVGRLHAFGSSTWLGQFTHWRRGINISFKSNAAPTSDSFIQDERSHSGALY
jgi:hypothetical protein